MVHSHVHFRTTLLFLIGFLPAFYAGAQGLGRGADKHAEFKVFPNPSFGEETFVSLKGFQSEDLLVVVYDMLGKEIYSRVAISEKGGFLFSLGSVGHELHSGVYLIVASKNDVVFRQKLIVK